MRLCLWVVGGGTDKPANCPSKTLEVPTPPLLPEEEAKNLSGRLEEVAKPNATLLISRYVSTGICSTDPSSYESQAPRGLGGVLGFFRMEALGVYALLLPPPEARGGGIIMLR